MKLPKKIKVLSRDYTVRSMTDHEASDSQAFGKCDRDNALILIAPSLSGQIKPTALLHELIHAIIFEMGIYKAFDEGDKVVTEEDITTIMANGLAAVIRDNPGLMPDIQKGLK